MEEKSLFIRDTTLWSCDKKTSGVVEIPEIVDTIMDDAFEGCNRITGVVIPAAVQSIVDVSFKDCENLESIVLLSPDTEVCREQFEGTKWLEEQGHYVSGDPYSRQIYLGNNFLGCKSWSLYEGVNVKPGTVRLSAGCCKGSRELRRIKLPDSLRYIERSSFEDCRNLKSIELPPSLQRIGASAFRYTSLTSIELPDSLVKILAEAFDEVRLTALKLPAGETTIFCTFNIDHYTVGSDVKTLLNSDGKPLITCNKSIDFQGNVPEEFSIDSFMNSLELIRINTPKRDVRHLASIKKFVEDQHANRYNSHFCEIIYAAPEPNNESSNIPGYFRATATYDGKSYFSRRTIDTIDEFNTKYVLSLEPVSLERYTPIEGTKIVFAAANSDCNMVEVVNEPIELVRQKIASSLADLSKSVGGIAGLIDTLEILATGGIPGPKQKKIYL